MLCEMCKESKIPEYIKATNPTLYSVMQNNERHTKAINAGNKTVTSLGRRECNTCKHAPPELRCERSIIVSSRPTAGLKDKLLRDFHDENEIPYVYSVSGLYLFLGLVLSRLL